MSDDFPDNKGREQRATGQDGVSVDRRQVLLPLRDVKHTEICQAVPIKLSSIQTNSSEMARACQLWNNQKVCCNSHASGLKPYSGNQTIRNFRVIPGNLGTQGAWNPLDVDGTALHLQCPDECHVQLYIILK